VKKKAPSIKTWWKIDELQVIFPDAIEKMSAYLAAKMPAVEAETRQPVPQPNAPAEMAESAEQPAQERDVTVGAALAPKRSKDRKSKKK
jgi:hypothetical protein